jgi:hypothetical protein
MQRHYFCLAIASIAAVLGACHHSRGTAAESPSARPTTSETQRMNNDMAAAVLASIAGKEQLPASQVFKNVNYLANTSARTFVQIMNGGYAKALGVSCLHCHVEGDFASDEKRPKRAAREMQIMHRMVNQELAKMQNIQTPPTANRAISCIACHRGETIPRP